MIRDLNREIYTKSNAVKALEQQSPTVLAPGTHLWKTMFPWARFQDDSSAFIVDFVSLIITSTPSQIIRAFDVGG